MIHSAAATRTSNNITLMRHLAALFVLITHSYALTGNISGEWLLKITGGAISLSKIGLILFFFISGFLITQSLVTSAGTKQFIWKRFLRIYPALIMVVLLTVFVLGPAVSALSVRDYFSNRQTWEYLFGGTLVRLRFTLPGVFNEQGVNGSLWTLPIEFRLYLLLAILSVAGLIKNRKLYAGLVLLFLAAAWASASVQSESPWTVYLAPYFYWGMYFLTGSMVYFFRDRFNPDYRLLIFLLAGWYLLRNLPLLSVISELACFSCLAMWLSFKTPVVASGFFRKNDFSYSMYLYAYPLQLLIISLRPDISPWGLVLFTSMALIPFCLFSWNCIEKPALKWKYLKW